MNNIRFYKYKLISVIIIIIIMNTNYVNAISEDNHKYKGQYVENIVVDIKNNPQTLIYKISRDLNNKDYNSEFDRGAINSLIGYAYYIQHKYTKSEYYLLEAIRIFEKTKNMNECINVYMLLAESYYEKGDHKSSLITSSSILSMLDKNTKIDNDLKMRAKVVMLSILIETYKYFDLEDKIKGYIDQIEKITSQNKEYENEISLKAKFRYYLSKKQYDLAQKAIDNYEKILEENSLKEESDNISLILYKVILDIEKGDYSEVKSKLETIKKYYSLENNYFLIGYISIIEGNYYKGIKEYDKALQCYEMAYSKFTDNNMFFWSCEVLEKIIKMSIDTHDEKSIISYVSSYKFNKEKLDISKSNLIDELLTINGKYMDYELEQISKENELIKIKNTYMKKIFRVGIVVSIILAIVIMILIKQIHDRKKSEKKLKEVMNKDYLTQAYTRAYAFSNIETFIKENRKFSMALIDLDNFKQINDKYGHIVGDDVLKKVSNIGIKYMKKDDIFARYGGEEFLIVFADFSVEDTYNICENIRKEIENIKWEYEGLVSTMSLGIKEYKGEDIDEFTALVDTLLYKAKSNGKNQTCL